MPRIRARGRLIGAGLFVLLGAGLFLPAMSQAADTIIVEIRDYKFIPETLTVKIGTIIRWTNNEKRTSHSVQFREAGFHSERLFPEESWEYTFDKPGIYPYACDPHDEMKGVVTVVD